MADPRHWITPQEPSIAYLAASLGSPQSVYEYMAHIRYVPDYFLKKPFDVVQLQEGDCDEQAVLLCSLLRALGENAFVRIAAFPGHPVLHAWVLWWDVGYGVWRNLDPSGLINFVPVSYGEPGGLMMNAYLDFNDLELYDYGGLSEIEQIFRE